MFNHPLASSFRKHTFAIIFDAYNVRRWQQGIQRGQQGFNLFACDRFSGFIIQSKHLLGMSMLSKTNNRSFDCRWSVTAFNNVLGSNHFTVKRLLQQFAFLVFTNHANAMNRSAEGGNAPGNVSCTTNLRLGGSNFKNWDRCIWREPLGISIDDFIEHIVPPSPQPSVFLIHSFFQEGCSCCHRILKTPRRSDSSSLPPSIVSNTR